MKEQEKAIKNHDDDNVATVFAAVQAGNKVPVYDKRGNITEVLVQDDIPYGHKIALTPIQVGEQVTKYGEEIGIATKEIQIGQHVHIHNIDSIRGRGDWNKGEKK